MMSGIVRRLPVFACVALLFCQGCSKRNNGDCVGREFAVMGTYASVMVPVARTNELELASAEVSSALRELEARLTVFNPDSEVSAVNRLAGVRPVAVSKQTRDVIRRALEYGNLSHGAFDITIGRLARAWGFNGGTHPDSPLTSGQIEPLLDETGYTLVVLSGNTVFLEKKGMDIDLGGIAKGYAVDVCCATLEASGITNALVNLGGNIRCLGHPEPARPWRVGVRNPFDADSILGTLEMSGGDAVATSGNYERFVTIGDRRYAHIIDPRTGRPVTGMAGVTVLCRSATDADALSTALFVLGRDEGKSLLSRKEVKGAIIVPDRKPLEIWVSDGVRGVFKPDRRHASRVRFFGKE